MRLFSDVASRVDDPFLRRAVELAERARGHTAPNPLVGCVVVRDGRIVGEGYHPRAGEAHAEVFALAGAGAESHGADVYVTLEPCQHHGRTPPCTDALLSAGVRRVVIGMPDPSVEAGGGAEVLRAHGVVVDLAEDSTPFEELNAGWLHRLAHGRPLVSVKLGLSLDSRVSLAAGARSNMTGTCGAQVTALLRRRADAVLVGASTVAVDDPSLTRRADDGTVDEHQPLRIVLLGSTHPPAGSTVFTDHIAPTLVLVPDTLSADATASLPEHVLVQRFDASAGLLGALEALGARGVNTVLVEAGPRLATSLYEAGLADEWVFVTGGGVAGTEAPSWYRQACEGDTPTLARPLVPCEAGIVGDVSVTVWRPSGAES